ncbi:uncharacterized protein LOC122856437 [Aphidius gifuensis]|uniref:uncharacterized protein LOC122856437 n=1 Tax=Aphidius gifuensis TaxID=684658 RepID=UPI001CDC065D|nr:uncharacterized protein LOC122856437 [Aphidius gifuensis]
MKPHNGTLCFPDPALENKVTLEFDLLNTIATQKSVDSSEKIFTELSKNYSSDDIGHMTYSKLKKKAQRIKATVRPPQVDNIKELATTTRANKPQDTNASSSEQKIQPNSTMVVIGDRKLAKKILDKRETTIDLYLDGTFSISPAGLDVCQTYIIQAGSHNQAFPIAYVLMERRTENSYKELFTYVFNELAPEIKNLSVKAHMDFEIAAHNALRMVLPGVEIIGCLFHMTNVSNI